MSDNSLILSQYCFLFAHGAGADKDSEWMLAMDSRLNLCGLEVKRFNFPYMNKRLQDGKRRPPDRQPVLLECLAEQLQKIPENKKIILGGKSMGGRMASLFAAQKSVHSDLVSRVAAVICMGFPFHPPSKVEKYRGDHLQTMERPTLILQGERDNMGSRSELAQYQFSQSVAVEFITDGDHSFKPRVKSGLKLEDNLETATQHIVEFVCRL